MTNARELTKRLADLLRNERTAMADFLLALSDFDRRKAWRDLGHTGLFMFLHRELGLSKGAAHYRKTAAELVQRCPSIVEPLRDGRLCLSSVVELAKVLTPENQAEVLPRFFHRSKREAMEVTAELRPDPAPPTRAVVTKVSAPPPAAGPVEEVEPVQVGWPTSPVPGPSSQLGVAPQSSPRDVAVPLTADLRRFHVTVSRRFLEKLAAVRDALSHSHPGATEEELLEAGLDLVLAAHAKRKGLVAKPRSVPPPPNPDSDDVPAHVKREVWNRDGGRCQFRLEDGTVCGSTFQLEYDHIRPRALGGPSTVENLRLACKAHNLLAARRVLGGAWMDGYARAATAPPRGRTSPART